MQVNEKITQKIIKRDIPNRFSLPPRIKRLGEVSYNFWWAWNAEALLSFKEINRLLWEKVKHNPVTFLRQVDRSRLNAAANDRFYMDHFERVVKDYDSYIQLKDTWFSQTYPNLTNHLIAYFSFEFGLHESLPVYAGGLGILAGDHLKQASDLGIPLVGVGFIYSQGYFTQHITEDGWQETTNYYQNLDEMPVIPLKDEEGTPLQISVQLSDRKVFARIWEAQVGRVKLYLLDTNVDTNSAMDRTLTARLYSNDLEVRISQEILLGIGGVKALRLLGYSPDVWHMNEGHSAFLALERLREMVEMGSTYEEAREKVRASTVFTTHTAVPAGIDRYPIYLVDKYFPTLWPELGLTRDEFVNLGKQSEAWGESFSMPVLALHLAKYCNAVSELNGEVSRSLWKFMFPDQREVKDVPIIHITNGVHTGSWLAPRMSMLFERYLGSDWIQKLDDPDLWLGLEAIPDDEIWQARLSQKGDLVNFILQRAREEWLSGCSHPVQVISGGVLLDNHSLTIGFARRFATYKRGNLILSNYDRLLRIINNPEMPIQLVFAGKAHPADEPGKMIIQQIYRAVKDPRTGGRMVFLEDYDMNIARHLVQGVDIWMNTPRRPNEASGTSGMKAAINGVLNFSVLDGWWREAYNGVNGWAIGDDRDYEDPNQQDAADAESLYNTLENEIAPLYYRNHHYSHANPWVSRIKESLRTLIPQFSTMRMVKEYLHELYLPVLQDGKK
jgi:glycogen phosphorylase